MNFFLSESFKSKAQKLCRNNLRLRQALAKQFSIFQENHYHPSLRLHKLSGKRSEQYVIWIMDDVRAVSIKRGNEYVFLI